MPNNCTLTLVGDFDPSEAKTLIEKYFGPFAPGKPQARPGVNIVITSYSIHYTKLYDTRNLAGGIVHNDAARKLQFVHQLFVEIRGFPLPENAGGKVEMRFLRGIVITSYSIHYTKLYDT